MLFDLISDEEYERRAELYEGMSSVARAKMDAEIYEAARKGHRRRLEILLEQGGRPDKPYALDEILLAITPYSGCVMTLIANRADPRLKDERGYSCLINHIYRKKLDPIKIITRYIKEYFPQSLTVNFRNEILWEAERVCLIKNTRAAREISDFLHEELEEKSRPASPIRTSEATAPLPMPSP